MLSTQGWWLHATGACQETHERVHGVRPGDAQAPVRAATRTAQC